MALRYQGKEGDRDGKQQDKGRERRNARRKGKFRGRTKSRNDNCAKNTSWRYTLTRLVTDLKNGAEWCLLSHPPFLTRLLSKYLHRTWPTFIISASKERCPRMITSAFQREAMARVPVEKAQKHETTSSPRQLQGVSLHNCPLPRAGVQWRLDSMFKKSSPLLQSRLRKYVYICMNHMTNGKRVSGMAHNSNTRDHRGNSARPGPSLKERRCPAIASTILTFYAEYDAPHEISLSPVHNLIVKRESPVCKVEELLQGIFDGISGL